ncbi:hypothetical protein EDB81DRAFT_884025 [Dactylonectria macrodidyma]|uniref:DUF7703 domain-containing protein n=1 Tax=Dactylonectria macrodidyma TaxID=307937 RepID=A0A9P9ESB3_9HYPO|nr:hypothetical protein EDB81DRAFT_884025 [Dactylonectria macrodidyma]
MNHLIYIIIIILLNATIVALKFADYYNVKTGCKSLAYSIKLKLEFSVLNRLVGLTQSSQPSSSYTRSRTDATAYMALDTFVEDCAGGSRVIAQRKRPDEAPISSGGDSRDLERSTTAVVLTTEIAVHSD